MMTNRNVTVAVAALLVSAVVVRPVSAERVRYHYSAADLCGKTLPTPASPTGAIGERISFFGLGREPYNIVLPPTYLVTFRHPYTNQNVTVPLALPPDTPRMAYTANRAVFNYGVYTVETVFFPDGSVDVIYDSGLLRPLRP
jgi:hypothetical protein